jgi:hypothetical protein
LEQRQTWQAARARLDDIRAWCGTAAANVSAFSYQARRGALDALNVQVTLWRADHQPRWEITADVRLNQPASDCVANTPALGSPSGRPGTLPVSSSGSSGTSSQSTG